MHNSIKIDFEGIALEDGGTLVKDVPYVVGLKSYHFILSNLSLGGVIQNDISVEAVVTLESVIENEGQDDEFTSYHQQIVFKNVYGYDVTIYDKSVTCVVAPSGQDVLDAIAGGTLENAKPIYWHGLALTNTGSTSTKFFNFHILNNSNEAFTLSSFIDWAESIDGIVDIPVTGVYRIADVPISIPTLLRKNANNTWRLYYNSGDTMGNVSISMSEFSTITDAINKIN